MNFKLISIILYLIAIFVNNSLFLSPITPYEIVDVFASISNSRALGNDGLLSEILKFIATPICQQLTHIFNLPFTQQVLPKLLKRYVVVPIYKGGCHLDPSNYRPISNLTIFSKLLEKLYYNCLMLFINSNNILNSNQFGFMKNKSTMLASANLLSSIINRINNNKKTVFAFLDLKKDFDFINHELLFIKLKHYDIRGFPLFG